MRNCPPSIAALEASIEAVESHSDDQDPFVQADDLVTGSDDDSSASSAMSEGHSAPPASTSTRTRFALSLFFDAFCAQVFDLILL